MEKILSQFMNTMDNMELDETLEKLEIQMEEGSVPVETLEKLNGLGVNFRDNPIPDYETAFKIFLALSRNFNYSPAQVNLGVMYLIGQGVPKDEAKAIDYFGAAARSGNAYAYFNLAMILSGRYKTADMPEITQEDYDKAAELFLTAGEKGIADAFYEIGALASQGKLTYIKEQDALTFFQRAARNGSELGSKALESYRK